MHLTARFAAVPKWNVQWMTLKHRFNTWPWHVFVTFILAHYAVFVLRCFRYILRWFIIKKIRGEDLLKVQNNHKTKVTFLARFTKAQLFTIKQDLIQDSEVPRTPPVLSAVSVHKSQSRLSLWLPWLSEALLSGLSMAITAIRHRRSSFCTWPTYSLLVSWCSLPLKTSLNPAPLATDCY